MKKYIFAALAASACVPAFAVDNYNDSVAIFQERTHIVTGNANSADADVMRTYYSRENMAWADPLAPRFILLDRQGQIAFGIGGQMYATASYDFDGAVNSSGFATYDISVPSDPALRQRFGADLSHSSLFLKLVGKTKKYGIYQVYMQANFTGDNGGYGFRLKQAYVTLGHLTAGLASSTFTDAATEAPTVDPEGPSGQVSAKNMLFRYVTPVRNGFSAAISAEVPSAAYTTNTANEAIAQRVPDIPAYVQYSWAENQHVRISGLFRDLAYRNTLTGRNHLKPGWGVQFSGISNLDSYGFAKVFGHIAYGRGFAHYVNDLGGSGFDLMPVGADGEMEAPKMMAWTAGVYLNFTPKLTVTGSFSRAQTYGLSHLGGDTYRYGQYAVANAYYQVDANFRVGAEYIHGWRKNYDGEQGNANRLDFLLQYAF